MGYVGDGPKPQLEVGDISTKDVTATGDLTVDTDTLYVDSTNNRVGVGTVSPDKNLEIKNSTSPTLRIGDGTRHFEILGGSTTQTAGIGTGYSSAFTFNINSTEKARLDSSGNLLVGMTSAGSNTRGAYLDGDGFVSFTRDNDRVMVLGRGTGSGTDGDILEFRKDGTTVGSIGYSSGNFRLDGSGLGLHLNGGANTIYPSNGSGSINNGVVDLGLSVSRFKDLYLSGGAYLGGTGSANYLDDYEEGTWTPSFGGTTGNPTVDYNVRAGNYVKIGALVKATFELRTNSISGGSGDTTVYGLPFSPTAVNGTRAGNGYITYTDDFASNQNPHSILITQAETRTFVFVRSGSDSRSTLVSLPLSSLVNATGKNFLIGTLIYTST